ncbi:hypothetical protein B0H63DRAFT_146998 [Podospora didyma]|uniref:Uncharacterized protein n=1 Tax=Podospora didyma TaxID=330526 RepID=A0AAE0U1E7_9PEZI|nr:hypothetical protein B0H63DRAFT_146998 [Podospora didyma]
MAADYTTSIIDIMSSPDPLNEAEQQTPFPFPPSTTRRTTRSQASQRMFSLGSSPKKQTFELDVGDNISPQKILVTVETEDAENTRTTRTKRRLFQPPTPTPRRGRPPKTTMTTTVPLRGLTDDEAPFTSDGAPTSMRKTRKPKAGTPTTNIRKRPGTPAAKLANPMLDDVATSEMGNEDPEATPRPSARRGRPPKRKPSASPEKKDNVPSSQPRKRGRPRKHIPASDEVAALSEQESTANAEVEDNVSVAPTEDYAPLPESRAHEAQAPRNDAAHSSMDEDDDIWLATLSDQLPPVVRRQVPERKDEPPPAVDHPSPEPARMEASHQEAEYPRYDDYDGYGGMDAHSEADSLTSDNRDSQDREDTVMAGEEFTMISLHSLPSMQLNSSMMAPEPQEMGDATSLIINRTLEALRQSQSQSAEQAPNSGRSASPIADKAPEPSFIEQEEEDVSLLPEPNSPQMWARSPRRTKNQQPLGKQLAIKSVQHVSATGSPNRAEATEAQDTGAYDDSFSEIPDEVLVAATPRRRRQPQAETEEEDLDVDIQPSVERPSTVNHSNPQSESNRLLTPDETPSPIPSDDGEPKEQTTSNETALDFDVSSSPPFESAITQRRRNLAMLRHSRTNSTETPAEHRPYVASPAMAAINAQGAAANLAPPEIQPRPTLSPIVRAGRALQLVTSDPPSPPGRDSVLRSPFRGSANKFSQSPVLSATRPTRSPSPAQTAAPASAAVEQPDRPWLASLSLVNSFVVQGAQKVFSPRNASASGMEDPFVPGRSVSSRLGSVRNSIFGFGMKSAQVHVPSGSVASSARANSPDDDDVMSWQDESSPSAGRPQERSQSTNSSLGATRGSFESNKDQGEENVEEEPAEDHEYMDEDDYAESHVSVDNEEAEYDEEAEGQERADEVDDAEEPENAEEADDEDDIWAIEAQRPSSPAEDAPLRREPVVIPPRRGKLPSPWRKNSRRLVYSDELYQLSENNNAPTEADEFSMLSQGIRNAQAAVPQNLPPPSKVDLSAFFSSPAALPELQPPEFGLFNAFNGRGSQKTTRSDRHSESQKLRFSAAAKRKQAHEDSLADEQPHTNVHKPAQPIVAQKEFQVGERYRSNDLFSPARNSNRRAEPVTESSSPVAQEKATFGHIPQKMNFTPVRNSGKKDLFKPRQDPAPPAGGLRALFGGSTRISAFFTQVTQTEVSQGTQIEDDSEDENEDDDNMSPDSSFIRRQAIPVPDRAMSPTKSCMRSPQKPKTPGPVVEFTSSTLSPLAQAQARAERQASPEKRTSTALSSSSFSEEHDKENYHSQEQHLEEAAREPEQPRVPRVNVSTGRPTTSSSSSQAAPPLPSQQPLSKIEWSRNHWLKMQELLHARRDGGTLKFQLQHASAAYKQRRAETSRKLLGKIASAEGEPTTLTLEQWHVDIVTAFQVAVPGCVWDEKSLALRVFALLVGEERRRTGTRKGGCQGQQAQTTTQNQTQNQITQQNQGVRVGDERD